MKDYLPLRAIVAFEAVARIGSVTRAADELGVTQSAVSRQIASLETHVNAPLFFRVHRQLQLTPQGRALYKQVTLSLNDIQRALQNAATFPDQKSLTVATHATFALKWLIPRLARFKSKFPTIAIRLKITPEAADFSREFIDCAIQYDNFVARNLYCRKLDDSFILPVCHPERFADLRRAIRTGSFAEIPLIYAQSRPKDWTLWFQHFGVAGLQNESSLIFENSFLAYEAAYNGLGVAIAHRTLILDDLRSGRLKGANKYVLPIEESLNFVTVQRHQEIQSLHLFEEWLVSELKISSV